MTATLLAVLSAAGLALALLYAAMTAANLAVFRAPPPAAPRRRLPAVSILIPARDEAANIGAALDSALGQHGIEVEVVVLDDGSTDGTAALVAAHAGADQRLRLARGADLPSGWNGKQHACHQLARLAAHPLLLFVDADVRLAPDAAARLVGCLEDRRLDLVSGFPRQITGTLAEKVAIPQIMVLLLGYLPLPMARLSNAPSLAAGCGQLMLVRAEAYHGAGGHAAFRGRMHDGLNLPRNVRAAGGRTDIVDATPVAACRMYGSWAEIWAGFSKNATEGMARPLALPVWTVLLGGGHILPWLTLALGGLAGSSLATGLSLAAIGLVLLARIALALATRQSPLSVLLHPVGVALNLAVQWSALLGARRGRRAVWRGRAYDVNR